MYRGNPFQVEIGLAYAKAEDSEDLGAEEPVRLMRFANRVPLLYMGGACAMNKASTGLCPLCVKIASQNEIKLQNVLCPETVPC